MFVGIVTSVLSIRAHFKDFELPRELLLRQVMSASRLAIFERPFQAPGQPQPFPLTVRLWNTPLTLVHLSRL